MDLTELLNFELTMAMVDNPEFQSDLAQNPYKRGTFSLKFKNIKPYKTQRTTTSEPEDAHRTASKPATRQTIIPGTSADSQSAKNVLVISAKSSGYSTGNSTQIRINEEAVLMEANENNHHRGLHVVVVNPATGKPEHARVFDTYHTSDNLDQFISGTELPDGSIVVVACQDDCTNNLSATAKRWLTDMGSAEFWNLGYRCGYAFIGTVGREGVDAVEQRAKLKTDAASVT